MTDQTTYVAFESVGKHYDDSAVLDSIDLCVRSGEFHCLAGPNGAGKSTLFRLAAGLTRPTTGRVERRVDGVGCGFQTPNFYPDLTVAENLDVFAGLADATPDDSWVETLSEALRLDRVAHQRGDELSAGFATALDLGLALLSKPSLVLLDEPLSELDGASRERVVEALEAYRTGELAETDESAPGRTVVVATHNVGAFEEVATRVTLLADGDVVLDAPYDELRAKLAGPAGEAVTGEAVTGEALQSRYEDLVKDHWGYGDGR